MNQLQEKQFSLTRGFRFKPHDFLTTHIQKRGKTFFSSTKAQKAPDLFRKTEFKIDVRFDKGLYSSATTPLKRGDSKDDESKKRIDIKTKKSIIRIEKSPYLNKNCFIDKMIKLLVPVKGPNESLKLSIKKYNDMNLRNAELLIVKKSEAFSDRMKAYSVRMGLPQDTKLFIINSRDNHIRDALIKRGWVESNDRKSILYHLKWTYKDQLEDYQYLQEGQFFNHFKNNQQLTNKNCLRKNIKRYPLECQPNFPISFDLEVGEDKTQFQKVYLKFQMYRVLNQLAKQLAIKFERQHTKVLAQFYSLKHRKTQTKKVNCSTNTSFQTILYRSDLSNIKANPTLWESLLNLFTFVCFVAQEVGKIQKNQYAIFNKKPLSKDFYKIIKKVEIDLQFDQTDILDCLSSFYVVQILKLWFYSKKTSCQSYGFDNMWIVKPTGVSRGSGITITSDIMKIAQLKHGRLVQKYIQKPLLLACRRKFDIRQWVLVRSVMPLKAYAFKKCYARCSSMRYSNQNYENLQKHLTNYSQNKESYIRQKSRLSENYLKSRTTTPKSIPLSSVLSEQDMASQIPNWSKVKDNIMRNIMKTLHCCKFDIVHRDECFQVFGFDVILDTQYKPYVLEVNLSPACEKRQFLEEYLSEMSNGIIDMLQGGEPTHWFELNEEQMNKKAIIQYNLRLKQEKARMIQKWWRSISK